MDMRETCICPECGHQHGIEQREIALYKGLAKALWAVYLWCQKEGRREFKRSEINKLMGQVAYSRFGDWVYFGGLIRRHGKGKYELDMEKCHQFFDNALAIPTRLWKDPITKTIVEKTDYRTIHELPSLMEFLDDDKNYIALYKKPEHGALL